MKSMRPPLAAIFFMTYFHRAGGPWPPRPPPGSATGLCVNLASLFSHASVKAECDLCSLSCSVLCVLYVEYGDNHPLEMACPVGIS